VVRHAVSQEPSVRTRGSQDGPTVFRGWFPSSCPCRDKVFDIFEQETGKRKDVYRRLFAQPRRTTYPEFCQQSRALAQGCSFSIRRRLRTAGMESLQPESRDQGWMKSLFHECSRQVPLQSSPRRSAARTVPVGGENAFASGLLETEAHATNPAEKIDEGEVMPHLTWLIAPNIAHVGLWSNSHKWTWEFRRRPQFPLSSPQFLTVMVSESTAFLPDTPSGPARMPR
jgi:hypothetical protein